VQARLEQNKRQRPERDVGAEHGQPASVLLRPQLREKPGSRAAKLEKPAMPKISAMHRAM
jgi:hypothetical protein